MTSLLLFIAMPFLGIRIGIPTVTGGGDTTPPAPSVNAGSFYQIFFH